MYVSVTSLEIIHYKIVNMKKRSKVMQILGKKRSIVYVRPLINKNIVILIL